MTTKNNNNKVLKDNQISRQEAIKKIGKYAALTAIGTFIVLNPQKSQAQSLPSPDANPFDNFD